MMAQFGLAFVAGLLSILSPCVLPLVPLVLGAAAAEHRFGAVALAGGLALSFVAIGLFVATIGFAIGLDAEVIRTAAAIVLVLAGVVLMVPFAQAKIAVAAAPIGHWADARFGGASRNGFGGQFGVGLLLGAVWSPCVGPTLGAASLLAAQSRDLPTVAVTMGLFGVGAALPLLVLGLLSHDILRRWRGRIAKTGSAAKAALGAVLVLTGVLTVSGYDKRLETALVELSPPWLTAVTTRF